MVNMGNIIAGLKVAQFFQGNSLRALVAFFKLVFIITVKDLVIGIAGQFLFLVNKTLADEMLTGVNFTVLSRSSKMA
jgi:hypothetical protein